MKERWGLLWISENKIDGRTEHLLCENCIPVMFNTRREAREYRDKQFGYIRSSPDLRAEPHGWKLPRVCRVSVTVVK